MRPLLCAAALTLLVCSADAADMARPAKLSDKEIADGWLLLLDGETTFGWKALNDSKWTVSLGMIAPQAGSKDPLLVTTTAFGDFELHAEYQVKNDDKAKLSINCDKTGKTAGNDSTIQLRSFGNDWIQLHLTAKGGKIEEERSSQGGNTFSSTKVKVGDPPKPMPKAIGGHIALAGEGVVFRNIKLKPLGLQSIFNGKDLTGWKEHPGKKSKFSVQDGVLNIKDGPGDLQTEKALGDFVLQLECISNGKHLNSGVFFRCRPGEYQQGYEAQIHNGFGEQPKEYTIEDFDPETNKLLGTRKEKYLALDYGTGAIYRRQPARKQMAKDNEWFGMTVVAQGRHIGVWVNGVMVTDWTDNRPAKDNARNGYRAEAGPISLQGHDPTTDLSFRNFRVMELKEAEKAKKE